jgi:chromate transporter
MTFNLTGLRETARFFLKMGLVAFGGPSAHIAMLEDEVVARRHWMSREHFLDLVGATNLIPGPNSTEMMMHVGYERHGWVGLVTAGSLFVLPAALISGFGAWLYVRYGSLPELEPLLFGIKPAILAVILAAVWRLGKSAVKGSPYVVIGAAVAVAVLLGLNEVVALILGAVGGTLFFRARARFEGAGVLVPFLALAQPTAAGGAAAGAATAVPVSLGKLALFFLKVGSILYGSGYVLVAFIKGGLVDRLGWLTESQLLDAVAFGQVTPGPVLSTATFIGYLVLGAQGAAVATAAIFLPSFIFVALLNPWIPRLRQNPVMASFLDAVNVTAVALMAAVMIQLGVLTLTSPAAWVIALASALAVLKWKVAAPWLVLGGGILGYVFYFLGVA